MIRENLILLSCAALFTNMSLGTLGETGVPRSDGDAPQLASASRASFPSLCGQVDTELQSDILSSLHPTVSKLCRIKEEIRGFNCPNREAIQAKSEVLTWIEQLLVQIGPTSSSQNTTKLVRLLRISEQIPMESIFTEIPELEQKALDIFQKHARPPRWPNPNRTLNQVLDALESVLRSVLNVKDEMAELLKPFVEVEHEGESIGSLKSLLGKQDMFAAMLIEWPRSIKEAKVGLEAALERFNRLRQSDDTSGSGAGPVDRRELLAIPDVNAPQRRSSTSGNLVRLMQQTLRLFEEYRQRQAEIRAAELRAEEDMYDRYHRYDERRYDYA